MEVVSNILKTKKNIGMIIKIVNKNEKEESEKQKLFYEYFQRV